MSWVLLRGLMREQRHWGSFVAALQHAYPDQRILTLDFAGNGVLSAQSSATSVTQMVEQLRAQLGTQSGQQQSGKIRLMAISLGAMVAVAWAERYPDEIQDLTLINTSLAPHSPFYQRLRPRNYAVLVYTMLCGSLQQREQLILRLTSQRFNGTAAKEQAAEIVAHWVSLAQAHPVRRRNVLRQLYAAMHYRAPDQAPAVALRILAGAKDALVNPQCSITLAQGWNAELRLHPEAGHDLPLDDADWVIRQTLDEIAKPLSLTT